MKAKKALIDSGLLAKDFSTAEEILERRKYLLKCTYRIFRSSIHF